MSNRLIKSNSPYLLQHSNNPVDWYPWDKEAFDKAKKFNMPIILSIGYSTCHWCHVMEKESFEDLETAKLMNENFVCIKVDREERPDVDSVYMKVTQTMTGRGGWPMTVFLTPDKIPFYAGTYFPPTSKLSLPSFNQVLTHIINIYKNRKPEIQDFGNQLQNKLALTPTKSSSVNYSLILNSAFDQIITLSDNINGGIKGSPKFPQPLIYEFLLRCYISQKKLPALNVVESTLTNMAYGGIYDQIGGGFHRYSMDEYWTVPHFEKMLYDNALLSKLYLHLYQITNNPLYLKIVEETLDYIKTEMTDEKGGFFSAEDADSDGQEGTFYLWSYDELDSLLSKKDFHYILNVFNITKKGNFENQNILTKNKSLKNENLDYEYFESLKNKLKNHRNDRIHPFKDDKIITSWNGLMMSSFAEAAKVLNRKDYLDIATKNANFIIENLENNGKLKRIWRQDHTFGLGYLEDYSFYSNALLTLYEATFNEKWLDKAIQFGDVIISDFLENMNVLYDTSNDHDNLFLRPNTVEDGVSPSGASMSTMLFLSLYELTHNHLYQNIADNLIKNHLSIIQTSSLGYCNWLAGIDFLVSDKPTVTIIGNYDNIKTRAFLKKTFSPYFPNLKIAVGLPDKSNVPIIKDKKQINGEVTVFVCNNFVCQPPCTTVSSYMKLLSQFNIPIINTFKSHYS